jgi:hypothetical protein
VALTLWYCRNPGFKSNPKLPSLLTKLCTKNLVLLCQGDRDTCRRLSKGVLTGKALRQGSREQEADALICAASRIKNFSGASWLLWKGYLNKNDMHRDLFWCQPPRLCEQKRYPETLLRPGNNKQQEVKWSSVLLFSLFQLQRIARPQLQITFCTGS